MLTTIITSVHFDSRRDGVTHRRFAGQLSACACFELNWFYSVPVTQTQSKLAGKGNHTEATAIKINTNEKNNEKEAGLKSNGKNHAWYEKCVAKSRHK